MPSVSGMKRKYFSDNTGKNGTLADVEYAYYAANSGLGSSKSYSLADHKRAFLETATGLSGHTIKYLEKAYWAQEGVASGSYGDMATAFYLAATTIIFRDDFNRVDENLQAPWIPISGGIAVSGNKAIVNNNATMPMYCVDTGVLDCKVSADCYIVSATQSNTGVTARVVDGVNYISARYNPSNTSLELYKFVGTATLVGAVVIPGGPTAVGTIIPTTLTVKGTAVEASVVWNGQTYKVNGTVADAILNGATADRQGLRVPVSYAGEWDNFLVAPA